MREGGEVEGEGLGEHWRGEREENLVGIKGFSEEMEGLKEGKERDLEEMMGIRFPLEIFRAPATAPAVVLASEAVF